MAQQSEPTAAQPPQLETTKKQSNWTLRRIVMVAAGVLGGIIILLFVIGVLLALFTDPETTAASIQIIRDVVIIIMGLEFILIIVALAILILQIARLVNLLQNEVKPVLENTQTTVNHAKGTVEFVSTNVTAPIVKTGAFLAGAGVFIREFGGLRRAVRPSGRVEQLEND